MRSKVFFLIAFALAGCRYESDLPKLFAVPNTKLVNEKGQPFSLDANKGYVTVYDFIFTNCEGTCPMMTASMRKLTPKVPKDAPVRFVSISVDPARDTPAVLQQYAKRMRNDDRWTFLTGDRQSIVDLSVKGFKLAAGDPGPNGDPLLHSSKFAVADKNGMIREYYGGTDGDAPERIAGVVRDLLRETN